MLTTGYDADIRLILYNRLNFCCFLEEDDPPSKEIERKYDLL